MQQKLINILTNYYKFTSTKIKSKQSSYSIKKNIKYSY